jgi:predicted RNase H-like nuclease (RuvC/YqgF family)
MTELEQKLTERVTKLKASNKKLRVKVKASHAEITNILDNLANIDHRVYEYVLEAVY